MTETSNPMEAFYTREKANEGIKLPLFLPTGEASEHWLEIYGIDSDAFRTVDAQSRREALNMTNLSPEERDVATADLTMRLRATLVKGWSFDQPFSQEAALAFIRQAPQMADAIDKVASNRNLFFGLASLGSLPTPSTNSNSTPSPKAPASQRAPASSKSPKGETARKS